MGWDMARENILAPPEGARVSMPKSASSRRGPRACRAGTASRADAEAAPCPADGGLRRGAIPCRRAVRPDARRAGGEGELANTLVIITSDNGASAEGAATGLYNETRSPAPSRRRREPRVLRRLGWPATLSALSYGWAVAGNTPFRYYKQTTYEGGTRVPLVVAWPKGIAARGELRSQFVHVADIAPTMLDAAGVPLAATVNDVPQIPMEGRSIAASFAARAGDRTGAVRRALWQQGAVVARLVDRHHHRFAPGTSTSPRPR